MESKLILRQKRKRRIRAKIFGTAQRPRLSVFRSGRGLYVQFINDAAAVTLVSQSSKVANIASAKNLGEAVGATAQKAGIKNAVFDRSGYRYHGIVQALVETIREGGIKI